MTWAISTIDLLGAFILGCCWTTQWVKPAIVKVRLSPGGDGWVALADEMRARAANAKFSAKVAGAGFNILNSWSVKDGDAEFQVNMTLDTDSFASTVERGA